MHLHYRPLWVTNRYPTKFRFAECSLTKALRPALQRMQLHRGIEAVMSEGFAAARWGADTAFVCHRCGHTRCYLLKTRPRVRQCQRCRAQRSVTAGTLLHGTRIPLADWLRHLDRRRAHIPSCTEVENELGVARSTAWHFLQRLLLVFEQVPQLDRPHVRVHDHRGDFRRPRKPMVASAPADIRQADARRATGWRTPYSFVLGLRGELARVLHIGLPNRHHRNDEGYDRGLGRWLDADLRRFRHTVSLRWLPRWVTGLVAQWNAFSEHMPEPPWVSLAMRHPAVPLKRADPWLGAVPSAA